MEQTALSAQVEQYLIALPAETFRAPFRNTILPAFLCPSDPSNPKIAMTPGNEQGFHVNYTACNGSTYATPTADPRGLNLDGVMYGISKVKLEHITDGTSNTAMVSELLQGSDTASSSGHDVRGRMWNTVHANTTFSTIYPPNSTVGDNVMGYCGAVPGAPCGGQSNTNAFSLARSKHTGGVNVCRADGSVRFVTNSITPNAWLWSGSRAGGEVIPE